MLLAKIMHRFLTYIAGMAQGGQHFLLQPLHKDGEIRVDDARDKGLDLCDFRVNQRFVLQNKGHRVSGIHELSACHVVPPQVDGQGNLGGVVERQKEQKSVGDGLHGSERCHQHPAEGNEWLRSVRKCIMKSSAGSGNKASPFGANNTRHVAGLGTRTSTWSKGAICQSCRSAHL
jgi:hypothetical protein